MVGHPRPSTQNPALTADENLMETELTTLVPPRRLGTLLRQARVAAGLDLEQLAAQTLLTVVDLDDLERGRRMVDDQLLEELVKLYGVEDAGLMPTRSRLVIDLDENRIAVDDAEVMVEGVTGPDAVLARYLALVYRLRDLPLGTPVALRDVDLEVLSASLEIDSVEVTSRLKRLMVEKDEIARDQKRIRRRLLLPLVGVVIAASSAGVLVLVAEVEPVPDPILAPTAGVATDVGNGAAVVSAANPATGPATDIGAGAAVVENSDTD